jgi:predicted transcriptional regulator YdeE
MEPRIIYKPAFTIVGFAQDLSGDGHNSDVLWDQLAARYQEIPFADPDVGYGVHIIAPQSHRYLVGLGLTRTDIATPADMAEYRMGPHTYAVFTHSGRMATLAGTVDSIYRDWLPGANYVTSADFYFEFYDDHFQPDSPLSTLFIWVPVSTSA